jgi:hypothetical protein
MVNTYRPGTGIAFAENPIANTVTIRITDEELIRNPAVWDAVMILVDQARAAGCTRLELTAMQPTQPTQPPQM